MQSLQNAVQTQFWAVRDYLAPVLKDSKFKEHGRITPDEFVAAGDFLVYKFPTWQWESGDKVKLRDYLPPDKQYLVQRSVPCIRRVSQMQNYSGQDADDDNKETLMRFDADELLGDIGGQNDSQDEWVATHTGERDGREGARESAASIPDIPDNEGASHLEATDISSKLATLQIGNNESSESSSTSAMPNLQDIPDIDDDNLGGEGVTEPEDEAAVAPASGHVHADASRATLSVRTYDCLITYDKYYQTPRMWLSGLSPTRQPLTTQEIFQDVSSDYAQKTVTIEPFPHKENVSLASVHPCKHANVMKKVIERMNVAVKEQQRRQRAITKTGEASSTDIAESMEVTKAKKKGWGIGSAVKKATGVGLKSNTPATTASTSEDDVEGLRVDQYLLVFLKFLSNVVPTIELDATTSL